MNLFKNLKEHSRKKTIGQLVANFRNEYITNGIDENKMNSNPIYQFEKWFREAVNNKVNEPNIMHLATANNSGKVSCRAVLLKGFDEKGFVFYTNYQSSKAADLEENNNAAITFLWMELFRQVRIEGTVQKVSSADSDIYFASRPRQSQIGAISSAQSKILNTRDELDKNYKEIERQYIGKPIPRPQNWGGYCIVPQKIEFWQGRSSRLHDRILYTKDESDKWIVSRLFP